MKRKRVQPFFFFIVPFIYIYIYIYILFLADAEKKRKKKNGKTGQPLAPVSAFHIERYRGKKIQNTREPNEKKTRKFHSLDTFVDERIDNKEKSSKTKNVAPFFVAFPPNKKVPYRTSTKKKRTLTFALWPIQRVATEM